MQPQISKTWIAAVLVFLITQIVKKYNINMPEGWEQNALDVAFYVVQYGSFLVAAWWSRHISHQPEKEEKPQYTSAPRNYTDMVPVMNEVHKGVNKLYEDLKTGKVNESTQDAIDAYLKIQAILKEKGEQNAGTKAG